MKVLIIEDEAPAFRRLQRILEASEHEIEILEVLDTVESSIAWLKKHQAPDLIFMDIQLADGLSFEIFESVEIISPVIFTTAYDEYALKAFKVNSIDYLLKPIDEEKLAASLAKFELLKSNFSQMGDIASILKNIQPEKANFKARFLVKQKDKLISIKTKDIAYFNTEHGIVYLFTKDGQKKAYDKPLDQLESQLDPEEFYRMNRQFIASIDAVESALPYDKGKIMAELQPKTAQPIIVSREKAADFKRWLGMG